MNPDMNSILLAIASVAIPLILRRLKLIPDVSPTPDTVDPEAANFLTWILKVKTGGIVLDSHDKETMRLIKSSLADIKVD